MSKVGRFFVVIPTMWKYKPFGQFLIDLNAYFKFTGIGRIALIDNDVGGRPDDYCADELECVDVYEMETNVGVNPAWNFGAQIAPPNSILCFLNDDVAFDFRIFARVAEEFVSEWRYKHDIGVIGISPNDCNGDGTIKIKDSPANGVFGFGTLFFIKKENWIPIPSTLKIYFGDNWVFDTQWRQGRQNKIITDALYYTPYAQTVTKLGLGNLLEVESALYTDAIAARDELRGLFNITRDDPNSDIGQHLPVLLEYANKCKTVCEFGVRDGASTLAFLTADNVTQVTSYDIVPSESVLNYIGPRAIKLKGFDYRIQNVLEIELECAYDMLFIDTEHTREQLEKELSLHAKDARKYIAFHDTGEPYGAVLLPVIMEFMMYNKEWRVAYHSTDCHGLTILERI